MKTLFEETTINGMRIETHDFTKSYENPKGYVSKIASLSYGKGEGGIKNKDALWDKLLTESNGRPSSVFEFIWVEKEVGSFSHYDNFHIDENGVNRRYVNFRSLLSQKDIVICDNQNPNPILTFKLNLPITILRQIQRHREVSYMELSRRRAKTEIEMHIPDRVKDKNVKELINNNFFLSKETYEYLIQVGVPQEVARWVLPQGVLTEVWVQFRNPVFNDSWFNFIYQRTSPEAQKEIQDLVNGMVKTGEKFLFTKFGADYEVKYLTAKMSYLKNEGEIK